MNTINNTTLTTATTTRNVHIMKCASCFNPVDVNYV